MTFSVERDATAIATDKHANGNGNGNDQAGANLSRGTGRVGVNMKNGSKSIGNMATTSYRSRLQPADAEAVQDLICVGFGPASLAIAVALHDALEAGTVKHAPRVLFLEKQAHFAWHAGMLLPGAKMQISFIKDLATLRDPRSAFTFINYLHRNGRLVEFTNLSTFLPARAEYEDYLRWCASSFDDSVLYNNEVLAVEADKNGTGEAQQDAPVTTFRVVAKDLPSGVERVYRARNVLMAIGGTPSLPSSLPAAHPHVIHSSQYEHLVPAILNDPYAPYRVAVVGAGQSAAEIFNNIQALYPRSHTYLVMRSEFLRPSDDSPFVNSIFNPEYIDSLYPQPASYRKNLLAEARPTNYGVVRLELIEALYERMYHQRRELGPDEKKWPHRIMGGRRVVRVDAGDDKQRLRLLVEPDEGCSTSTPQPKHQQNGDSGNTEELDIDLIIAATGYQRSAHVDLLRDVWPLLPEKDTTGAANGADEGLGSWAVEDKATNGKTLNHTPATTRTLSVSRDYRVKFLPGRVARGSGIWLQGCCEGSHGLIVPTAQRHSIVGVGYALWGDRAVNLWQRPTFLIAKRKSEAGIKVTTVPP